jgi:SAM-dependent methyltransferase
LVEVKALQRLHDNMANIMHNRETGDEILADGGLLADFYDNSLFLTGVHSQIAHVFDSVSHANPNLRILELKGGKGHTARLVLDALSSKNGIKRYRDYTVTGVSEAALQPARGQLAEHRDVVFSVLDIQQDALEQGLQAGYDVVFASQAVHTASSIAVALQNAWKLLKADGKLILVETTGNSAWVGLVGGAQAGYWHGMPDGRIDSPFLNVAEWDVALRSAGFSGASLILDDYPQPRTHSTILVATFSNPITELVPRSLYSTVQKASRHS